MINNHTIQYPFDQSDLNQNIDYDGGANIIYVGYAVPGTPDDAAAWQIKKYTYNVNDVIAVRFADGSNDYNKIWNNRAAYDYSV